VTGVMRRLALLILVTVVLGVTPSASAITGNYIGVHWRRAVNPFTVEVVSSVVPHFNDPLARAARLWSESNKLDMAITPGNTSADARHHCAYITGKVHVCSSNFGSTGWVGLTQFHANGHHITSVRVLLNDPTIPRTFRNTVSCHELGHTLGLAHRWQSTSCMKQGQTAAHPDSTDYHELAKIYRHLDGMTPEQTSTTTTITLQ
jgi:hypothetical protein